MPELRKTFRGKPKIVEASFKIYIHGNYVEHDIIRCDGVISVRSNCRLTLLILNANISVVRIFQISNSIFELCAIRYALSEGFFYS